MKQRISMLAALLCVALPLGASAQTAAPAPPAAAPAPNRPAWQPSAAMRAKMDHARDAARTAALATLSPSHRAAVQGVIDDVNAGKIGDFKTAMDKIDAVLTYNEAKGILAASRQSFAAMHGGFRGPGGPPGPGMAPPGGPAPDGAAPPPAGAPPAGPPPSGAPRAYAGGPGGPDWGGPGGAWGRRHHRHHGGMMGRTPDAGGLLLALSVNHDRMMTMMRAMHDRRPM